MVDYSVFRMIMVKCENVYNKLLGDCPVIRTI